MLMTVEQPELLAALARPAAARGERQASASLWRRAATPAAFLLAPELLALLFMAAASPAMSLTLFAAAARGRRWPEGQASSESAGVARAASRREEHGGPACKLIRRLAGHLRRARAGGHAESRRAGLRAGAG